MLTAESEPSEIARSLHDLGVKVVALKMGEKGSFLSVRTVTILTTRV
jgi:hypothetical protein